MTVIPIGSLNPIDDKSQVTLRRLLLAKQIYYHGMELSQETSILSKIIAVHNLHNAIEIVLRAIFLHFEIRPEKELNIGFENMLKEIDQHSDFKANGIKLPYRQEMRNLNQIRNLAQHHASEPPISTIEESRVFTRRFLQQTFSTYWGCDFDSITPVDMILDEKLKEMLSLSLAEIEAKNFKKALTLAEAAFHWASKAILDFLPTKSQSNFPDDFPELRDFSRRLIDTLAEMKAEISNEQKSFLYGHRFSHSGDGFQELEQFEKHLTDSLKSVVNTATYYSALLTSGVKLVDFKRFKERTPVSYFSSKTSHPNGKREHFVSVHWKGQEPNKADSIWVHNFVVNSLIHWQTLGINPNITQSSDALVYIQILLDWDNRVIIN